MRLNILNLMSNSFLSIQPFISSAGQREKPQVCEKLTHRSHQTATPKRLHQERSVSCEFSFSLQMCVPNVLKPQFMTSTDVDLAYAIEY